MKTKVILFFIFIFIFYGASYLAPSFSIIYKNITDYKINGLNKIINRKFQDVIFGSSITYGALGFDIVKYKNVLNMTSVADVTLVGHYFSLKRFLDNSNSSKNVYLFVMPEMINYEFSGDRKTTYSFFNNVFTLKNEIDNIKEVYPSYSKQINFFQNQALYWDNQIQCVFFKKNCLKDKFKLNSESIWIGNDTYKQDYSLILNSNQKKYIKTRANYLSRITFNPKQVHFLKKMVELCKNENINFFLVLEPTPETVYNEYIKSESYRTITALSQELKFKFIDMNQINVFKDNQFFDGRHLTKNNAKFYENLILKNIIEVYSK